VQQVVGEEGKSEQQSADMMGFQAVLLEPFLKIEVFWVCYAVPTGK
jgi:hypothetical protein